jgi:hypothetical protein
LHGEIPLSIGIPGQVSGSLAIFGDVGVFRIDVYKDDGAVNTNLDWVEYDYAGETNIRLLETNTSTNGTDYLFSFWIVRETGVNDLTLRLNEVGGQSCKIKAKIYHRKRDVDFVGSLA